MTTFSRLGIDAMNLKNMFLGDIQTDRGNLHVDGSPQCGAFRRNHPMALRCRERAVAVGTEITLRPPHRSRRALLTHRAPTLDGDEEPLLWPRMQDAWER